MQAACETFFSIKKKKKISEHIQRKGIKKKIHQTE